MKKRAKRPRPLVRLISWKEDLAEERARVLTKAGFEVDASPFRPQRIIGSIRDSNVAAIVIDLDRQPSHGRVVGTLFHRAKALREVPIIFAGGPAEKVERIRKELPDVAFTEWARAGPALDKALKNRSPRRSVKAPSYMEQWAGSTLVKKLDFRPDMRAALLGAPDGFEEQLVDLPEGVRLQTSIDRQTQMAIWFVRSSRDLEMEIDYLSARVGDPISLWIVYPKKTSRFKVDFTQFDVRSIALQSGLVDYKICAVDKDWTAMKFTRKKS